MEKIVGDKLRVKIEGNLYSFTYKNTLTKESKQIGATGVLECWSDDIDPKMEQIGMPVPVERFGNVVDTLGLRHFTLVLDYPNEKFLDERGTHLKGMIVAKKLLKNL